MKSLVKLLQSNSTYPIGSLWNHELFGNEQQYIITESNDRYIEYRLVTARAITRVSITRADQSLTPVSK